MTHGIFDRASRRRLWAALASGALALALSACQNSEIATAPPTAEAAGALKPVRDEALSERLHEITVYSPALEREVTFRLLLPAQYDAAAPEPYPVMYLLHGCCNGSNGHTNFTASLGVEEFTAGMRALFVMPEGGAGGMYSDWYNNGLGGPPRWETHHVRELLPWIERTYRVRRDRGGRGLMGISMGGHGAFAYAAKYPDLFGSAAAISPALDSNTAAGAPVLDAGAAFDGAPPGSAWGPRATEEVRWRGHNPVDLAENLGNTALFIRTGNGYESGAPAPTDIFEWGVHEMALNMHNALLLYDIGHEYTDYGPGGHSQDLFRQSVRTLLPKQVALLERARPEPRRFSYRSIEPAFSVYGWKVAITREVLEFARLGEVSESGFTLSGSGRARVTSAAWYRPGAAHRVTVDGVQSLIVADASGRLTIELDLGPARAIQQYRPGSEDGYLQTRVVTVAP
ncbi:MAG: hypothetical protein HYV18_07875 [Gammaproteobacteria bacterium]|nr:hypothetical protein [Gammaproteobacteria bacterium]